MCGAGLCGSTPMVDLWEQDQSKPPDRQGAPYLSRPALGTNNSQTCSQADQHRGCTFEDDLFLARAKSIVSAHAAAATDNRLFLFWAAHAAHGPREVPQATLDKFAFIDWAARRTYHALVAYLDGLVGEMVATLTNADMWDETLMVFSSGESRRSAPCRLL